MALFSPEANADSMLMLFLPNIFWHVSATHTHTRMQSEPPSTWFVGCSEIKNKKVSGLAGILLQLLKSHEAAGCYSTNGMNGERCRDAIHIYLR